MSHMRGSWGGCWAAPKTMFLPAGANGQVSYGGLSGGPFSIHPQTGLIVTTHSLDREEQEHHVLMGRAMLVHEWGAGSTGEADGCPHGWGRAVLQGQLWEMVGVCGAHRAVGRFEHAGMPVMPCLLPL